MREGRVIRDPVYGYIALPQELEPVVDHPLFQRLRRIAQTSLTSMVYPAATGNRFEHCLGAMHLARRGWAAAWGSSPSVRARFLEDTRSTLPTLPPDYAIPGDHEAFASLIQSAVAGVALLHDIGHPPFSHILEPVYVDLAHEHFGADPDILERWERQRKPFHEFAGSELLPQLLQNVGDPLRTLITTIFAADPNRGTWAGALHSIVDGEIDVDRLDYLMRDGQKAGTEFGAIDYERLIDALELHWRADKWKIGLSFQARPAVESVLIQRTQYYRWITFHPRVVGANTALARSLETFHALCESDAGEIQWYGEASPVSEHFGPLTPNLNYLRPGTRDLQSAVRGREVVSDETPSAQLEILDDQLGAEVMDELREELQAGVDDAVVIETLKRALLLARTLHDKGRPDDTARPVLRRFITFAEAALFRARHYLPAWKSVEAFGGVVEQLLVNGLRERLEGAYDQIRAQYASIPEIVDIADGEQATVTTLLESDGVAGVNHIFRRLLNTRLMREQLAFELKPITAHNLPRSGFWEIAYTSFEPIRTSGNLTLLYRNGIPRRLTASSPLAQALERVEANRSIVFVFYFLPHPHTFMTSGADLREKVAQELVAEFIARFPDFVRHHWAEYLAQVVTTHRE